LVKMAPCDAYKTFALINADTDKATYIRPHLYQCIAADFLPLALIEVRPFSDPVPGAGVLIEE